MAAREACAKINLALDVLRLREDGYHDLRMVMQQISLADMVSVEETEGGFAFTAAGMLLPEGKKTLEERAADAFFGAAGLPVQGLHVHLDKRTPTYAGLGGGSADVAALLKLLRDRWAPEMSDEMLEEIGLTVGSDVPFCIRGGTALAEGRGERLLDLPKLPPCGIVVCKPDFDIRTGDLFAAIDRVDIIRRPDIDGMIGALCSGDLGGVASRLCNVFEGALPAYAGEVFNIRDRLLELGALGAAMSGSGPAVFGIFEDGTAAGKAAGILRYRYRETHLAVPVARE